MTREEAIDIIRKNIPHLGIGAAEMTDALEELIPELRESEDEKMLDSVIRIITQFDDLAHEPTFAGPKWTHPYTKELAWLKSFRPQPKQEWSEEDERMLKSVIWHLRYSVNNGDIEHTAGQLEFWLNSLCPQPEPEVTDEEIEEMVIKRSRSSGTTKSEMAFYRNGIKDAIKRFGLRPSWKIKTP